MVRKGTKLDERISFLEEKCRDVVVSLAKPDDFEKILGLENVLVNFSQENKKKLDETTYFVFRDVQIKGALGIKRTIYENYVEVPYDGRDEYVTAIKYLAVSKEAQKDLPVALVAKTLLNLKGEQLFQVDTNNSEAEKVFEELNFAQVGGFSGGPKKYCHTSNAKPEKQKITEPQIELTHEEYFSRLPEKESEYYSELEDLFEFNIINLVKKGWTSYKLEEQEFVFTLTTGQRKKFNEDAFKIDVYDSSTGSLVGYNDILVPPNCDFALNENAVRDFPSAIPETINKYLGEKCQFDIERANRIRQTWPEADALWVVQDYRKKGCWQGFGENSRRHM